MSGEGLRLTVEDGTPVTLDVELPAPIELTAAEGPPITLDVVGTDGVTLDVSPGTAVALNVLDAEPLSLTLSPGEPIHLDVIGLIGPAGPRGPAGSGDDAPSGTFRFVQAAATTTWTVAHGLGYRPNVTVEDSAGNVVEGDVVHVDENTLTIKFSAPFGGAANLS